jgi:RimJ/RimL family protein N-acetyltransferase
VSVLGPIIATRPARRPVPCRLDGRFVSVVGLNPVAHAASLYEGTHGEGEDAIWRYLFDGPFSDRSAFDAALGMKSASVDPVFFAIVDRTSGQAAGIAAYMRIEPAHRVIEVGSIVYTRALQRTAGATEAMYLMARHAFEELGYRRYEWKCNALNEPSRRAALRLGFTHEGLFRQHMIVKGRSRDTAWYSMVDTEWPRCRAAFEAWLDPSNFDASGRQRRRLAEIRTALLVQAPDVGPQDGG